MHKASKYKTPRNKPEPTKTKKQLGHKGKQNIAKEIQQNRRNAIFELDGKD